MTVYFLLIIAILILDIVENQNAFGIDEKKSNRLLLFSFVLIYLVCVLRDPSVGRDIPGYELMYEATRKVSWNDFDYVYFENGYILLMKLCIKLGLSFQAFFAVVYFIILFPIYLFIKKYSTDKLFSVLIYVCYISFEFDLSGLRQAIAISIVLLAFIVLLEARKFPHIKYILLVLVAATFHKSAYIALVFLPLLVIHSMTWYTAGMIFGTFVSLFSRSYLFAYIKELFGKDSFSVEAGLHIGGNILFMLAVTVLVLYLQKIPYCIPENQLFKKAKLSISDSFMLKAFMFGIVLAVFFGEETSARSFMFFSQAIMVLIPNLSLKFDKESIIVFKAIFIVFFIAFFYFNTLKANNFDIVPYSFFWNK